MGATLLTHQDITLIDVREPEEFNEGHIPSSVNVPLSQLTDAFSEKLNEGTFQQVSLGACLFFSHLCGPTHYP